MYQSLSCQSHTFKPIHMFKPNQAIGISCRTKPNHFMPNQATYPTVDKGSNPIQSNYQTFQKLVCFSPYHPCIVTSPLQQYSRSLGKKYFTCYDDCQHFCENAPLYTPLLNEPALRNIHNQFGVNNFDQRK
jgi:hypothetical protein